MDYRNSATHYWITAFWCAFGAIVLGAIAVISYWIRKCRTPPDNNYSTSNNSTSTISCSCYTNTNSNSNNSKKTNNSLKRKIESYHNIQSSQKIYSISHCRQTHFNAIYRRHMHIHSPYRSPAVVLHHQPHPHRHNPIPNRYRY